MQYLIYVLVSFGASMVGAICGLGGGIIIKPVLDFLQIGSVQTIHFLSGCTVLGMSSYSVAKSVQKKDSSIRWARTTPLAIGAAIGGIVGKQLFSLATQRIGQLAGGIQAIILCFITLGALLYTLYQSKIRTHQLSSLPICICIGILLGLISSFLGIGGGPVNLVVFFYFFSMDTKTAAQNSLYLIFISQLSSFLMTFFTKTIPSFSAAALILMVGGGIFGGIIGRCLSQKMSQAYVRKLFILCMVLILLMNFYHVTKYFHFFM